MKKRLENRLADAIKDYGQAKGKSEDDARAFVMKRMNWTKNKLTYLCNNTVQPSFNELYKLAEILQVSTDRLYREVIIKTKEEA
ncbi:MAG TPA: hypothetical protein PLI89_13330 [Chitinophagales bacterium]|nr:hypothetical protein [Chitinophagales bacterium]